MPEGWYLGKMMELQGRGRMPGGSGKGTGGNCVCPNCGYRQSHSTGRPCYEIMCPKCSTYMTRE